MHSPHKPQIIKQIQNAGSAGIILPDIQIEGASRKDIQAIVEHLVDSDLVYFRPLRDTYHWKGYRAGGGNSEGESHKAKPPIINSLILQYLADNPDGVFNKDIATAVGKSEHVVSVYLSKLRNSNQVVGVKDPGHIRGAKRYYLKKDAPTVPRGTQAPDNEEKTDENKAANPAPDKALPPDNKAPHTEPGYITEPIDNSEENGNTDENKFPHAESLPPALDAAAECLLTIEYAGRAFSARGPHAAVDRWYQQFLDSLERIHGGGA